MGMYAPLRRVGLCAGTLLVAVALLAPGARPQRAETSPEAIAAQACAQLKAAMGPMFETIVGSVAACQSKVTAFAKTAIAKCEKTADPAACISREVQSAIATLAGGGSLPGGGGATISADTLAGSIATEACAAAQKKLGAKFAKQLGSLAACQAKIHAQALQLARDALAKCKASTGTGLEACVRSAVGAGPASLQASLSAGAGAAPSAATLADTVTTKACEAARAKLGAKFERRVGTLAACKAKLAKDAEQLVQAALAACKDSADEEGCIRQKLETSALGLQLVLGAGAEPSPAAVAGQIADEACQAARSKLGPAKFDKLLVSFDRCRAKIAEKAAQLAKDALARCAEVEDPDGCMRRVIERGAAGLQFSLGADAVPGYAALGDQIAEQACAAAYERAGAKQFDKRFGSMAGCKKLLRVTGVEAAQSALAACQAAPDMEACVRGRLESAALALQLRLGDFVSEGDIGREIAAEACDAAKARLGAAFASKLGSIGACRLRLEARATALGKTALTKCKGVINPVPCVRAVVEAGVASLEAELGLK